LLDATVIVIVKNVLFFDRFLTITYTTLPYFGFIIEKRYNPFNSAGDISIVPERMRA